ncbi:MAG TPA: MarR family transcriptional regulator [Actinomycetota bacterium]|nr:MarR family transcriptional regulator [Actinomycetota bacterium]
MAAEQLSPEVCRTAARLGRQMEFALANAGITLPQYRLLSLMSEGSSAGAVLADKLRVSRPTVTGIIDGLVGRGLVMREDDPDDRRRMRATMTPEGEKILRRADAAVSGRLLELLGKVDPERAATAIEGLRVIHDALDIRREGKLQGTDALA